ncbi:flagellar brake protein YcgR [Cronobacter sakazakii]|uniref:flagellar brake protein YcgR n=1 Tax=Cronobacter sakazakii TaxID=28141 RepID=UPI000CFCEE30|nr:flagellar brake protein [Cronobacter sakazakii]ELU8380340.1 flagellar brake protein [Cronobacter sakazakii]ELU8381107.1 flagellar brake protein [Cronobacter sakazakii]ELU8421129.1 flagellar brake protein [Cronobacter sakazakii]ELU8459723.1 flagellar brake protein [Cronobacter sakazakii]ELU8529856.1 flagellar brake protein [Cronobacter sakazakii]
MSNYSEQFLKQNPLAVLGILRDLQKSQAPIRLSWGGWQFISRILDASPEQLVLDFGSQASENQAVQKAKNIQFSAEAQGAKVEFNLPALNVGEFQNLPAFVAPLPEAVWFVQRREHFRITAPVQPQFYSLARMPDGKLFRGRLQDLSLGGMGTLLEGAMPKGLEAGMQFSPLELDLLEWGKFRVDAQLLTISERKVVDSKNETIATPRLSFRFMNVSPGTERELQRIIFALERIAREKASRVR